MVAEPKVETASRARRLLSSLFVQVVTAAVLGILVGVLWPEFGAALKLLGDAFIRAIKMIIAPLVFCVVVTGIAKAGDLRSVGRIGFKALVYFEVVSTLALLLGLVLGNLVRPGDGLDVDPATLDTAAVEQKTGGAALPGVGGFLLHVVPDSVIGAFADNQLLQVLLFAVLFGAALVHLGQDRVPLVLTFVEQAGEVIFKIVGYVMRVAPVAVFGSLAYLIGQYGLSSLLTYGKLIGVSYGAGLLFVLFLALLLRVVTGLNLWAFLRYTRAEFVLAIGTASSESVLPRMMGKLRAAGCRSEAVGLVLPTGYSFNLDGASIYLSVATLFMAQAVGIDLTIGQQLTVLLVLMLTSKGMAGIPGSAFLALSATAASVGVIPAGAVALLLGADRIMDTMRVVTNLLGNCVATFVVAKWEGGLDTEAARAAFAGRPAQDR
ncbi:aerobic C4-dicarboxylate transport protein [Crossiella equi]|uniref:Aerobic C4-dicarboxylate transport protein n=1 Tax=Crossiella equi TaxID=130796 RepID=A0ABS5AI07_9PSEU|nr:C4-dicarboxylate transporter DctA [Crossiella equi]MBP2476208.1 aerobic C4-dicarboxylate transport protein [Crossiella equi]